MNRSQYIAFGEAPKRILLNYRSVLSSPGAALVGIAEKIGKF